MTPLLIATQNVGKIAEFLPLLSPLFSVRTFADAEIYEKLVALGEVAETGTGYRENALIKARAYSKHFGTGVLTDDSGLELDALWGEPGIHSARFGGEQLSWPERWAHLYERLRPFPQHKWTARFRAVLCYLPVGGTPHYFEGVSEGRILPTPLGEQGFGYDPLFFSNELEKGFGQASLAEKLAVSHRTRAILQFVQWWKTHANS